MKSLITDCLPITNGKTNRCLSCGTSEKMHRRRYCSLECRQMLQYKLEVRTGLVRALNARYATFHFSDEMIIMDMLPYGSSDTFSFVYPRSPGKKPADDFSKMADLLGDIWWEEKMRTQKRYVASIHVFEHALKNAINIIYIKPAVVNIPTIKASSLLDLKIDRGVLNSLDFHKIIKDAYRRQAKENHPDVGGNAAKFIKIYRAYEDLSTWAKNPIYVKQFGFPDKWFYQGSTNRWVRPLPLRANGR